MNSSRVLFFSHESSELKAVVETFGTTYVLPGDEQDQFFVVSDSAVDEFTAPARIAEVDAKSGKVLAEHIHANGIARINSLGRIQLRSPVSRAHNSKTLWLLTQVIENRKIRQQIEALDWNTKTITSQISIPSDRVSRVLPCAVSNGCALVYYGQRTGELVIHLMDGNSVEVGLPLDKDQRETLRVVDVADDVICGISSKSRLIVIDYDAAGKNATVKFIKPGLFGEDSRCMRAKVIPHEQLILIALAPNGREWISEILLVSTIDGAIISQGKLATPAAGVSFSSSYLWALRADNLTFSLYDRELQPVWRQSSPLSSIVSVAP